MNENKSYTAIHGKLSPPKTGRGVSLLQRLGLYFYDAKSSWQAQPENPAEKPLTDMVEALRKKIGIKRTEPIIIFQSDKPQELRLGRQLALSTGLLDALTPQEVEAVIARQLIRQNHEFRDNAVLAGIAMGDAVFEFTVGEKIHHAFEHVITDVRKRIGLMVVEKVATTAVSMMMERFYERSCEYEADRQGAKIIGKPDQMIHALESLEKGMENYELKRRAGMSHWRRSLNEMADKYEPQWVQRIRKTANPLEILNSEPPLSSRVKALKSLEVKMKTEQPVPVSR